jgi:hypothetical protein
VFSNRGQIPFKFFRIFLLKRNKNREQDQCQQVLINKKKEKKFSNKSYFKLRLHLKYFNIDFLIYDFKIKTVISEEFFFATNIRLH